MQFHANAMLAARVTTPSNLGQERKFWTTNRLQRGYVPCLPFLILLFLRAFSWKGGREDGEEQQARAGSKDAAW